MVDSVLWPKVVPSGSEPTLEVNLRDTLGFPLTRQRLDAVYFTLLESDSLAPVNGRDRVEVTERVDATGRLYLTLSKEDTTRAASAQRSAIIEMWWNERKECGMAEVLITLGQSLA